MPTYLRKFYLRKLIKVKQEEKKEVDKAKGQSQPVNRPNKGAG
jgi:hypothetical protein